MTLTGKRKRDPAFTLRRVFVHSTARAHAAVTARAKKFDRATGDLDRLVRGPESRHYPDEKVVTSRIAAIASARRVTSYLRTTAGSDLTTGKPPHIDNSSPAGFVEPAEPGDDFRAWLLAAHPDLRTPSRPSSPKIRRRRSAQPLGRCLAPGRATPYHPGLHNGRVPDVDAG